MQKIWKVGVRALFTSNAEYMKNAKITVIVPVYNVCEYIGQCIESILNQTYSNIEIILVDDGSTDKSGDICDKFALNDNRITVIHKKNEGIVCARKTGLKEATGNLIAYVDGDDWIEPDMMERLYDIIVEQHVDIVMCGRFEDTGKTHREVYHGIEGGRYNKQSLMNQVYPKMIVNEAFFEWGLFPSVWDKLWKKEALWDYQMAVDDRLTMGEDAACTYPALLNANSIFVLHKCLYHYRQSTSSMVKKVANKEEQRLKFSILYNSVQESFVKYIDIYDCRKQWIEYMLFLMVPRADMLYQGIEEKDYLFPFSKVKRGSNIIIYGMGTYGQLLFRYIKRSGFCNVMICVDRNYIELSEQGISVLAPSEIDKYSYDAIVVANSFATVRESIYKELSMKYPKDKICLMDEEWIKSIESLNAFGLN